LITETWKRYFRPNQGGHVIAVLSAALGPPLRSHMTPYLVAKRGLETLLEAALAELGSSGLRASAVRPGYTDTPMLGSFHPHVLEAARARMKDGKFLEADAVADVIVRCLNNPPSESALETHIIEPLESSHG